MTVYILGTGGTIGIKGNDSKDFVNYADSGPFASVGDMLSEGLVGLGDDVVFQSVAQVRSPDLGYRNWTYLARRIASAAAQEDCEGIVVTHGTATLEETAFWLNLRVAVPCPVVVVGAQRAQGVDGSDVALNLRNAVRVAQHHDVVECGVTVVMDGEILSSRTVGKNHNYRVGAFEDRAGGRIGEVSPDGSVHLYYKPTRRHTVSSEFATAPLPRVPPRVEILFPYVGCSLEHVELWLARGLAGLVVAAYPPGLNSAVVEEQLSLLRRKGVTVAIASRAHAGRLVRRDEHRNGGIVTADNLSPQAARILLMEGLALGLHNEEVQRVFDEY